MKSKFFIIALILLNTLILVGYNNCGQISHSNKTSTQAINPGDFDGGDDGDFGDTTGQQNIYFVNLITALCNKLPFFDPTIEFPICYDTVHNSSQTPQIFFDDPSIPSLDVMILKLSNKELFRSNTKSQSCLAYVNRITLEEKELEALKIHIDFYFTLNGITKPKLMDLATAILTFNSDCTSFISQGGL